MIKVKVGNVLSKVQVNTGLRQGNALSPIIFNLVLEKVMMNISPDEGVKLDGTSIRILAYADDIVLLGNIKYSEKSVRKTYNSGEKSRIANKRGKNRIYGNK